MMRRVDAQKNLLFITKSIIESFGSKKIKGATARWEYDTAHITIFFDEEPSEDELEDASDLCTEIIAQMPSDSMLTEEFIVLKETDVLPEEFLAYERK